MAKNPILDELYAIREDLLHDAGGTLDALVDRLQSEEQISDRPKFVPRPVNQRYLETIPATLKKDELSSQADDR
jgi:hypothetical protein